MPKEHDFDGKSLLPLLTGRSQQHHETLFWSKGPEDEWAVRRGDWKLHWTKGKLELINLNKDPSETTDVADHNAVKVKELSQAYDEWIATMPRSDHGRPKTVRQHEADGGPTRCIARRLRNSDIRLPGSRSEFWRIRLPRACTHPVGLACVRGDGE